MLSLTPPQTVGPFFAILVPERRTLTLASDGSSGPRIVVAGSVRDGAGRPVPDALIEVWQADTARFGRVHADVDGGFTIEAVKPGALPGPDATSQAPHLLVGLFARGLLTRLLPRIYLADEPSNVTDPVLTLVPEERRSTLIADRDGDETLARYRYDIVLQGPGETVFFDV